MKNDSKPVEPEIMPDMGETAVEVLQGGASLTKAENDSLIQYSIRRPRDPKLALMKALDELDIDPEFASNQWYSIPYIDRKTGEKKPVEGLTVKAAMALGRCWGNCNATARLIEEKADSFIVEGVAMDYESLFRVSRVGSVSKYYKAKKTGKMVKWSDDRFPQLIGSASSKQVRNALLAIIPEPIRARYWQRARELAADVESQKAKKSGKSIVQRILDGFEPFKVTREMLNNHLGHPLSSVTKEEAADLRGILNALQSGEAKPWEIFEALQNPAEEPTVNPNAEAVDDGEGGVNNLFGGKAE